jgi:uncharacterized protein (DUF934 family)
VKTGNNIRAALKSLNDFSISYQVALDESRPLFRRERETLQHK